MKILVTGGAGFIGSHLVDRYVELGHEVTVLDDLSIGSLDYRNPGAEYFTLSLADPELEAVICEKKPDLINHHAAQANVRLSVMQPEADIEANVTNTVRLLRAAGCAKVKKIIFASTGGAIYGDSSRKAITESNPCRPISPYGINKLAAEQYVRVYSNIYGYQWTILRYSNVYGPRQNPKGEAGVISIFSERFKSGRRPVIYGNGEQIRDYVHVDDIIAANMLVLQSDKMANDVFNVATQRGTSLNDLFRIFKQKAQSSLEPEYRPTKEGDLEWNVLSHRKLRRLGWLPKISLETGIEILLNREEEFHVRSRDYRLRGADRI